MNRKIRGSYPAKHRHTGCTPEAVLEYVQTHGWNSSQVWVSSKQTHETSCELYQGNCNLRGENLLGHCFCLPGYSGDHCQHSSTPSDTTRRHRSLRSNSVSDRSHSRLREASDTASVQTGSGQPPHQQCSHRDDRCFYTSDAGVWAVSHDRWRLAQQAESAAWKEDNAATRSTQPVGDRVDEHIVDFASYEAVGPVGSNLGTFLEIGAGPWTQSKYMIELRQFHVDKYVLLEPNALNYARDTASTVYATGEVAGQAFKGKTVVLNAGAEHLDLMRGVFDTVLLVNVLEHTQNAIRILRNAYNTLKPGGMLIFNDRWWDLYIPSTELSVDTLYHPIRLKKRVFDVFLTGFDRIYEICDRQSFAFNKEGRNFNGTYFIGRKKKC